MIRRDYDWWSEKWKLYDGLYKFESVYPTFKEFKNELNNYLIFNNNTPNFDLNKFYEIMLKTYTGFYFRWPDIRHISIELADFINDKYLISQNEMIKFEPTSYTKNYKFDENIDDENRDEKLYIATKSESGGLSIDEQKQLLELKRQSIKLYTESIKEMRTKFFMDLTEQNFKETKYE